MKRFFVVLAMTLTACQPAEKRQPTQNSIEIPVDELGLPTRQPDGSPLTASYCDTEAAARIYSNLKACSMVSCEQGDKESCEIARTFAEQHMPRYDPDRLEGRDYNEARAMILAMGWMPIGGPCQGFMPDDVCRRFPEIGNCSGTGLGFCDMHFKRRDRCLMIVSIGGYPDGTEDGEPSVRDVSFSRAPCRKYPDEELEAAP